MSNSNSAAIYTRISRDSTGDGEGVERQEADCRNLAERLNLSVVRVYSDNDIGASERTATGKVRHGFAQMLEDAEQGQFTHILSYSASRLTRRLAELSLLVKIARPPHSITIQTVVSGKYDLATTDGQMMAEILASVDQAEANRIAERAQAANRHRALKGIPKLHRQRPFGWQADGITLDPVEAQHIRDGLDDLFNGASLSHIARKWEAAGIKTASGGETWDTTVLRRVLTGWRTAGVRTYHRKPLYDANNNLVMGVWESVITLDERERAVAILQSRVREKVRQGKWLLKGLVRCGECGGKMYGQIQPTRAATTYACKRGHLGITADRLEAAALNAVIWHVLKREQSRLESTGVDIADTPKVFPDQERLEDVSRKIVELMDAYNANQLSGDIVFPQVDKLDNERKDLSKARDSFLASLSSSPQPIDSSEELWASIGSDFIKMPTGDGEFSMTDDAQALAVARELKMIVVKKGKRGRGGWGVDAILERLVFHFHDTLEPQVARHVHADD